MALFDGRNAAVSAVKKAYLDQNANTDEDQTPDQAAQQMAEKIVDAIIALVQTGRVVTNGSATTQTGSVL